MSRYDIYKIETEEDDQVPDDGNRRFVKRNADQPKLSPIRRKYKLRQEEGMKPKSKRNNKKIQHRIKYDWQGE